MKRLRRKAARLGGVAQLSTPAQQYRDFGEVYAAFPAPLPDVGSFVTGPLDMIARRLGALQPHEFLAD